MLHAKAKGSAYSDSDRGGGNRAGDDWRKDLEESANQHVAVHSEDAADDNRSDKQVQKVALFGEGRNRNLQRCRNGADINEERRHECRQDCGGTDFFQSRQVFADLRASESAKRKREDVCRQVGRNLAQANISDDESRDNDRKWYRYDADPRVEQS